MNLLYRCLFIPLLLLPLSPCNAQTNNVWTNVKAAPNKAGKAVQKQGNKIRKFKKHLETWGLDTAYKQGLAIGARLTSTGWTGLIYYQRRISRTQSHFFQLSLSGIKHEQEIKQQRTGAAYPELGPGTPFIFGKINQVYLAQIGHGREFLLLPGVLDGNISLSFRAQAGFSLAMLKPYYLQLIYKDGTQPATIQEERYSDANSERFLNAGMIHGAAKFKQGLNEISYVPGGYADAAFVIEPMKNKTFIKTVTLGAQFAMHTKDLPLMADHTAYPWQACVYAGLSLGKRWR